MRTLEIEVIYKDQPSTFEWIPEDQLQETFTQISIAGLTAKVVREVPWQQQLAAMENSAEL